FLNHGLRKVSSTPQGFRHKTFRNYAMWLYGLNLGGWPISIGDIESGLTSIAKGWEDSEGTIHNNLKWSREHATRIDIDEAKVSNRGNHVELIRRQERYGNGY